MPELRRDPITHEWVVISTERAKRPHDFARQSRTPAQQETNCPFCAGNESKTPPEVLAYRVDGTAPDTPGWLVRVVPNLYPAFGPASGDLAAQKDGLYQSMNGLGGHEVIITSPSHTEDIASLPLEQVDCMTRAYIDRYLSHKANPIVQFVHIIQNYGRDAGASREHPHSQLFAIPLVPELVATELEGAQRHHTERGSCVFCDVLQEELRGGERIILENERFVVFAPYASRVPFEMWLMPKAHRPRFETMGEHDVSAFSAALQEALALLRNGLNDPPFNYWIHTTPTQMAVDDVYHWHLEILPKLSFAAGFELGTGIMINSALPETAAAFLREKRAIAT
jgi:UDPglucose--hexose-1-phosphate uridylyltransferase